MPLDPARRAAQSAVVVEGEVVGSASFWDAGQRRIYTAHQVRVFSVLKGAALAELTVVTEGGTVGLTRHALTNTLQLQVGEQGILFLTPAAPPDPAGLPAWQPYGSEQGFIRYNLADASAAEPFRRYEAINDSFYRTLSAATGQPRRVLQANPALTAVMARKAVPPVAARGQAPVISGFSPAVVPAGSGAVLTISGSGFGATRGNGFVEFRNADNGDVSSLIRPQASEYVSWSDGRIEVRVPSLGQPLAPAGSGRIRVTTNDQLQATSLANLIIPYAVSNVLTTSTNVLVRPNPVNDNGQGGYTFRFENGFAANAGASRAWRSALNTWRCQTGMNWDVAATPRTGRGAAEDGENSIGFDQNGELPANVLGRTTSYYKGCFRPDGSLAFYVDEIDMQFDDDTNWQFGPAVPLPQQLDFESVAVHELGHAQQLSHVILPRAVMHYAIARGQNSRAINTDDVTGGRVVLRTRGFLPQGCGPAALLPAPLTSVTTEPAADGLTLRWTSRDECFLGGFEVQRANGTDTTTWQTLATVPAGRSTYSYLDAQPPTGATYYRLRLRRPGTSPSFDNTSPLLATADATAAQRPTLFPNPTTSGPVRLQYPAGAAGGRMSLSVYDAVGRLVQTAFLEYQPGLNLLPLPLANVRPGWYVLRYRDSEGREGRLNFVRGF